MNKCKSDRRKVVWQTGFCNLHSIVVRIFVLIAWITYPTGLIAQFQLFVYSDAGKTNVSEKLFFKTAALGEFHFNKNNIQFGSQYDILSNSERKGIALSMICSRDFLVKTYPFQVKAFFLYDKISEFLIETNYGIYSESDYRQLLYKFGVSFKTYGLTRKAIDQFDIVNSDKLKENFNFVYSLTLFLKSFESKWNSGFKVSNMDYFLINQPTNPILSLEFRYKPAQSLLLFIESGYKSAGAFNLSVNSFGYSIKTGLKWKLKD